MLEAHTTEVKKDKEQKRIYNALDAKFPDKADAPNEVRYLCFCFAVCLLLFFLTLIL